MNIFFIIFKVYGILVTKIFFEEKFPLLFKFMTDWKSIQCICDIVLFGFQQQQIDELLRCLGRVTEVKKSAAKGFNVIQRIQNRTVFSLIKR